MGTSYSCVFFIIMGRLYKEEWQQISEGKQVLISSSVQTMLTLSKLIANLYYQYMRKTIQDKYIVY